jgi:hypothetical protein
MPDEGKISIGIVGWVPIGHPTFNNGKGTSNSSGETSFLDFQGKDKLAPGVTVSLPGGGHNAVRVSYFETTSSGNFTAANDLNLWSTGFSGGDYIATNYKLKNVKFSYDFVSWPFPVGSRRFRFKTLWQVQYVNIKSTFNAPLSTTDTSVATGSKNIILPTLGVGITEYFSRNVRLDVNASGFGIPHHAVLADVEAAPAVRVGRLELRGGVKLFYFKTSPNADFYMSGRLLGAFAGVRFYLN